jgi:DNA-binding MarR family transcriptional regulator
MNVEDALKTWAVINSLSAKMNNRLEEYLKTQYNLSVSEFTVISILDANQHTGLTIQQLESRVNLSQSAISRLISRLEKCRTVKRQLSEKDRRCAIVKLTSEGRCSYKETLPGISEIITDVLTSDESKVETRILSILS